MSFPRSKVISLCAALLSASALAATPDPLITTSAKLSLMTTGGVRSNAVHVDTNDGIVTLHGKVPSAEQKALAGKAVARVKGVREVRNMLQVVADADVKRVERADKEIQDYATEVLKADPTLSDSKISIKSVDKGVVFLTGTAATVSDHLRAVRVVDQVPGVRRVTTEVQAPDFLEPPTSAAAKKVAATAKEAKNELDDLRISSSVKLRLWTTSNVPSTEINVDTSGQVVTLFGIVPTPESKAAAGNEAAKVAGVLDVNNLLQVVAPAKQRTVQAKDSEIERAMKKAFAIRPELSNVSADVRAGVVRLTGTVDSEWDKLNAVRLARFAEGSRGVEEQLLIRGEPDHPGIF